MKKFIKYFILVLSICSILALSVSANGAVINDNTRIYCAGAPITLYTTGNVGGGKKTFIDNNVNVYLYSGAGDQYTPYYAESLDGSDHCTYTYNGIMNGASADIVQYFPVSHVLGGMAMYEPIYFNIDNYDINEPIYSCEIGIHNPFQFVGNLPPVYQDEILVGYQYNVAKARIDETTGIVTGYYTEIYEFVEEHTVSNEWVRFYNYRNKHIEEIALDDGTVWDARGTNVVWLMGIAISFEENLSTDQIYYENIPRANATLYNDYLNHSRNWEIRILNGSAVIDYEDFDTTAWITNSVKSFMDFEIIPGLSFAGILAILLGIPLLVWFLRLFAGG